MTLIFAFIFGAFIVGNIDKTNTTQEKKETAQVNSEKNVKNKSAIFEAKPEPKTPEPIKEEIKPEPKTPEPIKEEIKPEPKTPEPIKEEAKPEPIKEEIKPEPKTTEPKEEAVQEIDNLNEQGTSWLKLALYILGPLLAIVIGKNLYNRIKNNSSPSSASNYMRKEFKEEENPAQEEVHSDTTTEENPAQEEVHSDTTTEENPAQEEVHSDTTTEQETTEEEDNNSKND